MRPKTAGALVALTLASLAGVPAHADTDHVTMALPVEAMQFLGYYAAEDLGIFAQQQIEVKAVVLQGVASFNAVVAGSAEFSFSSGASLTRAAAHGQKMLAIAQMNNLPSWDVVIRKDVAEAAHFNPNAPLSERAKVIQGKVMAVQGINALDHAYLLAVAHEGGLDLKALTVAAMGPPEQVAAFKSHAIDGFVSGPPWPQIVETDGSAVIVANGPDGEPKSLVPIASSLLVTRPQLCAEHRSVCEKMGRAMVLASKAAHERPKDVIALLQKRFSSVSPEVVERSFTALVKVMPPIPLVDPNAIRKGDELNVEDGFMPASGMLPSYDGLSTNEYLK